MKRIASYKLQLVREGSHLYETKTITGADDATAILASWFKDEPYEHCTVMCLNIKGGVIALFRTFPWVAPQPPLLSRGRYLHLLSCIMRPVSS